MTSVPPSPPRRHLAELLRALAPDELSGLASRIGARVDSAKRIDAASQIARVLTASPDLKDPNRLGPEALELLRRLALAGGALPVAAVPDIAEGLLTRGLVFRVGSPEDKSHRGEASRSLWVLPSSHQLQLRPWEGENPRSLRVLLFQATAETLGAIASHYLGRPATPPLSLALETAWDTLGSMERLRGEVERLGPAERRLLDAIDREGGDVTTEELLELEKEPLRLRTSMGAAPSRRGIGFAVERRGLLISLHPNRHVIPSEVSAILGSRRRAAQNARRQQARTSMATEDHAPLRARFAADPGPLAAALVLATREWGVELRPDVGTPKSLIGRLASKFGRDPTAMALLMGLTRALGLWSRPESALAQGISPLPLGRIAKELIDLWRRGGAWDEGRTEPEVLRLGPDARDSSPAQAVREMVLEAIADLGDDKWVPWKTLQAYLKADERIPGLVRGFRRWCDRVGEPPVGPVEVARRMIEESLPALGVLDLSDEGELAFRVTPRGREAFFGQPGHEPEGGAEFVEPHVLRLGPTTSLGAVLNLGPTVEVLRAHPSLEVFVGAPTLDRCLSEGMTPSEIRSRLEAISPLPEGLARHLEKASQVSGRATYVATSGFLWVDDGPLREQLRTGKATASLFVDPSPPGGLLISPNVDLDRLARRCRVAGVEVLVEGHVVRAKVSGSSRS